VSLRAKLTTEASLGLAVDLAFKLPRVLAFMMILKLENDPIDLLSPFSTRYIGGCVPVYDLFGPFFNAMEIRHGASAILPFDSTDIAKFSATLAAGNCQHRLAL
jgi:hypothetical protein